VNYPLLGTDAWTMGFGYINNQGDRPDILQDVQIKILDPNKISGCKAYNDYGIDWNQHICAGDVINNRGICQGDNGGALFVLEDNYFDNKSKYVFAGFVMTYFYSCEHNIYPE